MEIEVGRTSTIAGVVAWVVAGAVVLTPMILGFRECHARGRERYQLQRIYIERCQGTPSAAERLYPYPSNKD